MRLHIPHLPLVPIRTLLQLTAPVRTLITFPAKAVGLRTISFHHISRSTSGDASHKDLLEKCPVTITTEALRLAAVTHTGTASSTGSHTHNISACYGSSDSSDPYSAGADNGNRTFTAKTASAGNHTHSVTLQSAGSHSHTVSLSNTGGGNAHAVIQPYIGVYIWRRVS